MENNNLVNEWLSEYKTDDMRRTKRLRLYKFLEWFGESAKAFTELTPKQAKRKLLEFQSVEVEKKTPNNSILSYISSAKTFYQYVTDIEIGFTRGQLIPAKKAEGYHEFSNGDLANMFKIANVQYKALIAVAQSGFSISDILSLDRNKIEATVKRTKEANERFAYIETSRKKTNAKSLLVLNPLALEWLEKWLALNKKPTLWNIKENAINRMLKRLAKRSIKHLKGEIKFHKIRSWTLRSLSKAGFNEFEMKYCVGKAIPLSDETYLLLRNAIEEKYPKIYDKYLSLEATALIQDREKYITDLEEKVVSHGIEIKALRKQVEELSSPEYLRKRIQEAIKFADETVKAQKE